MLVKVQQPQQVPSYNPGGYGAGYGGYGYGGYPGYNPYPPPPNYGGYSGYPQSPFYQNQPPPMHGSQGPVYGSPPGYGNPGMYGQPNPNMYASQGGYNPYAQNRNPYGQF